MNLNKILKVIGAIVAIAGVIAAVYVAIQKLTDKKEPEYFDDNDFFECDNELEIIDVKEEDTKVEEAPKKEAPKKKKAPAKKADKAK